MKNLYAILNVREDATEAQIRAAHRELTKLHHPDRNQGASEATERQQAINAARDVLCDEVQRAKHDFELRGHRASLDLTRRGRSAPTHALVRHKPVDETTTGFGPWIVGGGLAVIALGTMNSQDANGRFHGSDGKFRSGRWG